MIYLLNGGAGPSPAAFSPSASGGIAQCGENADADGQEPGGHTQRKQGITRHQLPTLAYENNDGFHGGHNSSNAGGGSNSLYAT